MEMIPSSLTEYTLENYLIRITPKSRIIYWIIIFFISADLIILPFIYVDIVVQARGYFQSEIEKQTVYSPFQGKITYTSVRNGIEIEKGDTLFIIDSETIKAQKNALQKKILENSMAIADLEKLTMIDRNNIQLDTDNFGTKRYYSEFAKMKNSLAIQFQKYQKSSADHRRNEILHNQNIIADADFETSRYIFKSDEENLNQVLVLHKNQWQDDLMERKNDAIEMQADLQSYLEQINNRVVVAPVHGEIIRSSDIQPGAIVAVNQMIAEISPAGDLIATCFIKPGDIGLIHPDQKVKIQIDALNHNEWGLLDATIIDISDDMIVEDGANAYFRIKCKPGKTYLSLKNGICAEIKKGMSFNARIIVTRRTLFNLLFDKAEKWFNPYNKNDEG